MGQVLAIHELERSFREVFPVDLPSRRHYFFVSKKIPRNVQVDGEGGGRGGREGGGLQLGH